MSGKNGVVRGIKTVSYDTQVMIDGYDFTWDEMQVMINDIGRFLLDFYYTILFIYGIIFNIRKDLLWLIVLVHVEIQFKNKIGMASRVHV